MTAIVWDDVGDRVYENGVDKGVLYLADGSGVPWNGLTSVEEHFDSSISTPLYFEGVKYYEVITAADYTASLKAFTYPEEFLEFEGIVEADSGFYVSNQVPKLFGLSYRTRVGNDLDPNLGYKIHVVCNLQAVPDTKLYKSQGINALAAEFAWTISSIPSKLPGFRATSHLIFDSTKMAPEVLVSIEEHLYGSGDMNPRLLPFKELLELTNV